MSKQIQLAGLLIDLEAALRNLACWDGQPPSVQALQSREPFCVDTLEFCQWLQWIFIPRIYHDLKENQPLPGQCNIAPMAEEWARMRAFSAREVIAVVREIDHLLSNDQQ